ncbi:putative chloride channel-like protein CLC-g [Hibiscus syriacus]|uniref:Chloride channel protein n=1 Tax=Hibiscus syriacus TaxID=106335 RepID=A0A6A2ZB63_HIBSY|nr:putative chloride channel-like protein CLC-g [Hibiscus syriacus]
MRIGGISTGLVGIFNNIAVENIAGFKLLLTTELMLKHRFMIQCRYYKAFIAYAGCNLGLAALAAALCAFIAPSAAGSGIPEVKAYLNGVDAYSIMAPSTLLVKIFGSVFGVAAGFVVGKEGPMVHTGSCIASLIGEGGSRKYGLTWRWLRYFKNDGDRRDLITCGAAAGVAAAFRAPVGGVLFSLEEAASWWSALLWRTFFTTAVVAIVLRGFIEFCSTENCGLFGQGGLIMYDISAAKVVYSAPDILAVILLGVIGGLLGSLYNYLVDKVLRTYSIINEWRFLSLFSSDEKSYSLVVPLFLQKRSDCQDRTCYYDLPVDIDMFLRLAVLSPPGSSPVILAGSCYGRLVGRLFEPVSKLDVGLFSLLGAASFLGGTMRMTVSLCVILLELTNDLLVLPLVMLVLLISKTMGDMFNKGVYDQIVKIKVLLYMGASPEHYMKHLVAQDVVTGPLITFSSVEKVRNIVHALRSTRHNGFPVIDESPFSDAPELCGLVLRSHLLGLKLEDLDIKEEETEMYVDLHPITNTSPYVVVETMSVVKAAVLFRELGLQHMCCTKESGGPPVVGILTRHDFLLEHILGLYPHIRYRK